ncbi:hypothetical protein ACWD3J_33520 [Streptomyces sp. NPDC002755]|uniref:hypothetical protein n=1 Tax=Streptomyces sp. NPDC002884 TaxID=3154544 RepID=UPI0033192343
MANRSRVRSLFVATALVAGVFSLTACQGDDGASASDATGSAGSSATASTSAAASSPAADAAGSSPSSAAAGGSDTTSTGGSKQDSTPTQDTGEGDVTAGKGEGVSGTWLGSVSYLAPGKYTVSDIKDTQQQFWLAEDTKIIGAGTMCAAGTQCTEAKLEAAAKGGKLAATVVVTDGIATTITEEP